MLFFLSDIKNRHLQTEKFEVSDNWPLMMSVPEMSNIYEDEDSNYKKIDETVRIDVNRPALNRMTFDETFEKLKPQEITVREKISSQFKKLGTCSREHVKDTLLKVFPFVNVFRTYKFKESIVKDTVAGLSVGMLHIPQGMGFALLAGVAPVSGLYSSFFPVLIYFLFGQSKHVTVGTMAIISIVVGTAVDREADLYLARRGIQNTSTPADIADSSTWANAFTNNVTSAPLERDKEFDDDLEVYKASTASALSLVASVFMFAMGICRLGVITTFMPTSFIGGFTTGAAFHIGSSQFSSMLGIKIIRHSGLFKLPNMWADLASKLPLTNIGSLVISLITLTILISFKEYINVKLRKKLPIPIPIEVIMLVMSTGISYAVDFNAKWGVRIVGPIPKGFPTPTVPLALNRTSYFVADSFIAAILCFTITISMADIFARKYRYQIDTNHELISNSLSYGISSFFHGFIGAAAPPRCFIQETCGSKSKIASIFTFSWLLVVILFIGPMFKTLPNAVLGCIIFTALFPLYKQFKTLPGLWRISKIDFSIWIITWASVTFLDVAYGLGIGILWALLTIPIMAMRENGHILSRTPFPDIYVPLTSYGKVHEISDVVLFRFENGLYFATVKKFKQKLFEATFDPTIINETEISITSNKKADQMSKTQVEGGVPKDPESNLNENISVPPQEEPAKAVVQLSGHESTNKTSENKNEMKHIIGIIVDCSAISYIDLMGLLVLKQLSVDYRLIGVRFLLANCTTVLIEKLEQDGKIGNESGDNLYVFPTIQDAISALNILRPSLKKKQMKNSSRA